MKPFWNRELARQTLRWGAARTSGYAELFCEARDVLEVVVEDGPTSVRTGRESGVGLRLDNGKSAVHTFTEDISEQGCRDLALSGSELAHTSRQVGPCPPPPNDASALTDVSVDWPDKLRQTVLSQAGSAQKAAFSEDACIQIVRVIVRVERRRWLVLSREGLEAHDFWEHMSVKVFCTGRRGALGLTGNSSCGICGPPRANDLRAVATGREAARRALRLLDSRPVTGGVFDVVVAPGAGALLFHEACGHALEADAVERGSCLSGELGRRLASTSVTLVDSAELEGGWGSYRHDDEGRPGRTTTLIEGGVLVSYMHDRGTASRGGATWSANGRRASYRDQPLPRMTNTYLMPGDLHPEEIIAATAQGMYAHEFQGGQANPYTGDFSFSVLEAQLIRDGKLTEMVAGATIAGNSRTFLHNVDLVGDDLKHVAATCVKSGQEVPIGVGQPTVRLRQMSVGGFGGGSTPWT